MLEFEVWDTKIKIDDDCNVYRIDKRSKKWTSINNKPNNEGYIHIKLTNNEKQKRTFKLHRIVYYGYNQQWNIFDTRHDNSIDHKDRCKTNNHIDNLRVATHSENKFNTKCNGYSYYKPSNKYQSRITRYNREIYIGLYYKKDDARLIYLVAKKYIGSLDTYEIEEMNILKENTELDIDHIIQKYIIKLK